MKDTKRLICLIAGLCAVLLVACGPSSARGYGPETEEALYVHGQRLIQEGRHNEALSDFLKLIEGRSDAAESHLDAGRIYLDHLNDPISAIYHFKKYLELQPHTEEAPMVSQMIETAKKHFIRQLPGDPFAEPADKLDTMALLKETRDENVRLKHRLAILRKRYAVQETQAEVPDVIPMSSSSNSRRTLGHYKRYTVEGGDTLSRISIKVYGDANRWNEIYQANRDILNSPHDLRLGQELAIPN